MTDRRRLFVPVLLVTALALAACGAEGGAAGEPATTTAAGSPSTAAQGDAVRILAIGDSVLAWNEEESTPAAMQAALRDLGVPATVTNEAVGGACLDGCGGEPIGSAYADDGWDLVVMTGGGNDLGEGAECPSANPLISEDLSGGLAVDLIDRITADGTVVVVQGYADSFTEGEGFGACENIDVLMDRYRMLAALRDDVLFVDAREVMTRANPEFYADEIHPSPEGSAVVGRLLAEQVVEAGVLG